MKHFSVTFKPDNRCVFIHAGATLHEAAAQTGIILNSQCGRKGICKKCKVLVEPHQTEVLACQHIVESDLVVTIPDSARFYEQKILTEGVAAQAPHAPDIYTHYRTDHPHSPILGLAVDIGTTTVVAKLIDMADAKTLATETAFNPQMRFGDDVISRITYAQTDDKLDQLHQLIIESINTLIDKLCQKTSADQNSIFEMCVVGNTTMNHIFLRLPVTQLGQAPYKAFSLDARDLSVEQMPLKMNPAANIHTVENIAGFVGADTTAMALAVDIGSATELTMAIDIGTNGEIVIGTADKLYAASCAAGPAFEGGRINCGSRAVQGAIEAVVYANGDIDIDVIGTAPPRSLCGSGLLDAVAVMLDLGIINPTGKLVERDKCHTNLPPAILSRITERNGQPAFILARAPSPEQADVVLTQHDIRQLQLAKAAIRTGAKILQQKLNVSDADIKRILLAGAFGNYLRPQSALRIGLLPDVPTDRIHFVGNAALAGAQTILLTRSCRDRARQLARKIQYLEIAHEKTFPDAFAEALFFPPKL
jgi:uncharacterized 2Fe-2S/4Fe-4S cluster protein (DUF4445 family)